MELSTKHQRLVDWLGAGGLYLFALTAWISNKPAALGLIMMSLACLLNAKQLWAASRRTPLVWVTLLTLGYVVVRAIAAAAAEPSTLDYQREDALYISYLVGFLLVGWCMGGSEKRILTTLILALIGFVLGRLEHYDLSAMAQDPRYAFGMASPIAFGQYAATAALGIAFMTPRLWHATRASAWGWVVRITWLLLFLLGLEAVFIAQSRGVWLSVALVLIGLLLVNLGYLRKSAGRPVLITGVVMLLVSTFTVVMHRDEIASRFLQESEAYGEFLSGNVENIPATGITEPVGVRMHMLVFGLEHWAAQPWFGIGPGGTRPLIQQQGEDSFRRFHDLHNGYLEMLLRLGIVGSLLLAATLWLVFLAGWRAWRDGMIGRDLYQFATAALVLHLLANVTNFRMLNTDWRYYWFIFAGAMVTFALQSINRPTSPDKA